MKNFRKACALCALAAMLSGGVAFAEEHHDDQHDNHTYVRHEEWKKGYHIQHQDWDRGDKVDYRTYHLRHPPQGYEWRLIDGNYVLGASSTGVITSVVVAGHH